MSTLTGIIDAIYGVKHTIFVKLVNAVGLDYDPTNGEVYK